MMAGCDWIVGPCVDGTQAGKRCGALVMANGRCARHTTAERDRDAAAYFDYVAACEDENLDAHDWHMWDVHGRPSGPLG